MKDVLKKGLLASLGLAIYTKKHIDQVAKELRAKGYTEAEAKRVLAQLAIEGERTRKILMKHATATIDELAKEHLKQKPQKPTKNCSPKSTCCKHCSPKK